MLILNDMIYRFPHKIISLHKNGNINLTNCNLESKQAMALVVNTKYVGNIIYSWNLESLKKTSRRLLIQTITSRILIIMNHDNDNWEKL